MSLASKNECGTSFHHGHLAFGHSSELGQSTNRARIDEVLTQQQFDVT